MTSNLSRQKAGATSLRIHTLEEIQRVIDGPGFRSALIDGIRDGFVALERGEFYAAPIQTLGLPPFPFVEGVDGYAAQTCVKSGYFKGKEHYIIKVASGGHPMDRECLIVLRAGCGGQWPKKRSQNREVRPVLGVHLCPLNNVLLTHFYSQMAVSCKCTAKGRDCSRPFCWTKAR
jgi:hypothetical protein